MSNPIPGPYSADGNHVYGPDQIDIATVHGNGGVPQIAATARMFAASYEMRAVLDAYNDFEADLVFATTWVEGLPTFTPALFDRLLEIQAMRNKAFAKTKGTP